MKARQTPAAAQAAQTLERILARDCADPYGEAQRIARMYRLTRAEERALAEACGLMPSADDQE